MVRRMSMKESLRPGVSRTSRIEIDRDRTIGFMGEEGRVYATPRLVQDIEHTCRDLILEHADANEDSVGINVSINHLAPTLPGMTAEITATVSAVEGRKVTFAPGSCPYRPQSGCASRRRSLPDCPWRRSRR